MSCLQPASNSHQPQGGDHVQNQTSCIVFRILSIQEQTTVVERSNICTLCLDWTITHSKDTCDSRVRGELLSVCRVWVNGSECGKKHNMLLHGSTAAIYNMVRSKALPPNKPNY